MSRIVVGVDGSTHAERALRWAVTEAQLRGAAVRVVHGYVVHPHAGTLVHDARAAAVAALDAVVERNRELLDHIEWTTSLEPALWSPAGVLVDSAEDVDLVVVGSRGLGGFKELLLGSISYRTAAHATAPVAVIREGSDDLDGRRGIVVGIDGSRAARRALRWACDEAGRRGVGVTVVHAYDLPTDSSLMGMVTPTLERYRTGLADEAVALVDRAIADVDLPTSTDVERVVKPGMPAAVLLSHAGGERLLVVGTHGRGAIGRALLGSVSHQCLHHAAGPVVVVP
jgi:nucleotide-binding universal stress UspA family protein